MLITSQAHFFDVSGQYHLISARTKNRATIFTLGTMSLLQVYELMEPNGAFIRGPSRYYFTAKVTDQRINKKAFKQLIIQLQLAQ